ncbi:hypothetical protein [Teredinibacter turnerae]|uniref:hypothetical protein n=1 Tax=Teredinibacter turnerae TaxID=2426 RepID=UPI00031EF969|nr:hypothetical protein [Teredinibacter turnerae]
MGGGGGGSAINVRGEHISGSSTGTGPTTIGGLMMPGKQVDARQMAIAALIGGLIAWWVV